MLKDDTISELAKVDNLYKRWLVGGNAAPLSPQDLPSSWTMIDKTQPAIEQRRHALILASQQKAWLLQAQQPDVLTAKEPLPKLPLPTLHDADRVYFRVCLEQLKKQNMAKRQHLLRLLSSRGYAAHPADWLPQADDDVPEMYWPWQQWTANLPENTDGQNHLSLTAENWDDYFPAQRLALLKKLRYTDPVGSRELVTECVPQESSEKRLKLVQALAVNLSPDDLEVIQAFTQDRSRKVAALAQQLLRRLGISENEQDEDSKTSATELAEWFDVQSKGLFKRRTNIVPQKLKSKKQQALRSEWLLQVPLGHFAEALSVDLPTLIVAWQFEENRDHDNQNFVSNAVNNLPDELISALLEQLLNALAANERHLFLVNMLLPRLADHDRSELMLTLLKQGNEGFSFSHCLDFIDTPLASMSWSLLLKTKTWSTLSKQIKKQIQEVGHISDTATQREILALGLIVPEECAKDIHASLVASGLMKTDPVLSALNINIKLSNLRTDSV